MCRTEASSGDVVDGLSAGASGADKGHFDFVLVNHDAVGNRDHFPGTKGSSVATLRERPARCAASTTAVLSL